VGNVLVEKGEASGGGSGGGVLAYSDNIWKDVDPPDSILNAGSISKDPIPANTPFNFTFLKKNMSDEGNALIGMCSPEARPLIHNGGGTRQQFATFAPFGGASAFGTLFALNMNFTGTFDPVPSIRHPRPNPPVGDVVGAPRSASTTQPAIPWENKYFSIRRDAANRVSYWTGDDNTCPTEMEVTAAYTEAARIMPHELYITVAFSHTLANTIINGIFDAQLVIGTGGMLQRFEWDPVYSANIATEVRTEIIPGTGGVSIGAPANFTTETVEHTELEDDTFTVDLSAMPENAQHIRVTKNGQEVGRYHISQLNNNSLQLPPTVVADETVDIAVEGTDHEIGSSIRSRLLSPAGTSLDEYLGVEVDMSAVDTSAVGRQSGFTFVSPGADRVEFSTVAQLETALGNIDPNAAGFNGVELVYMGTGTLTIRDTGNANNYKEWTELGGTAEKRIVVRCNNRHERYLNMSLKSWVPQLSFEGFKIASSGGHRGQHWYFRPGCFMSDMLVENVGGWVTVADADGSGANDAGHFGGLINCRLQYSLYTGTPAFDPTAQGVQNRSQQFNPSNLASIVGTSMVWCETDGHETSPSNAGRSEWAATAWDPVLDSYLGNERRLVRVFFNHFKGHNANEELVAAKYDDFWFHANYIDECESTLVGRYGNRHIFTGNVQDVSSARCAIRIHGANHFARWNVWDNRNWSGYTGTPTSIQSRGINVSVEDHRTDKFGPDSTDPAFRNQVAHYYQGTENADVQWNIMLGFDTPVPANPAFNTVPRLITINGPFATNNELSPPRNNVIKNNLIQSAAPLGVSYRIAVADLPSTSDLAGWVSENPDANPSDQIYLDQLIGNQFRRSEVFTPMLNPIPYPRGWVTDPNDPLQYFPEIPTQLERGPLFDSVAQMVT